MAGDRAMSFAAPVHRALTEPVLLAGAPRAIALVNCTVFAFDFGASIRAAVLGMGGSFHDLGGVLRETDRQAVNLQPLAAIDDESERTWAAGWLAAILSREGVIVTPAVREHLWSALASLASAPIAERTLTGLGALLAS